MSVGSAPPKIDAFLLHEQESNNLTKHSVSSVNADLESHNFNTYYDELPFQNGMLKEVYNNIKVSHRIIVFITPEYANKLKDRESVCSSIFHYALSHKGRENFIPIVLESGLMNQRKWTGALRELQGIPFINMTTEIFRKKNMDRLYRVLKNGRTKSRENKRIISNPSYVDLLSQIETVAAREKVSAVSEMNPRPKHQVLVSHDGHRAIGSDISHRPLGSDNRAYRRNRVFSGSSRINGSSSTGSGSWTVVSRNSRNASRGPWSGGRKVSNASYDNGAISANQFKDLFDADIGELVELIHDHGESRNGGGITITYGELFRQCGEEKEVLSGLLNRAKRKGLVKFTAESLGLSTDDNLQISIM